MPYEFYSEKKYENWSIFVEVIVKIKVTYFFDTRGSIKPQLLLLLLLAMKNPPIARRCSAASSE